MKPAHHGVAFRRAPAAQAAGALPQSAKRHPAAVPGRVKGLSLSVPGEARLYSIPKSCSTQREEPRLREGGASDAGGRALSASWEACRQDALPGLTQAPGFAGRGLTIPQARDTRFFKCRSAARRQKKCKMRISCRGPRPFGIFCSVPAPESKRRGRIAAAQAPLQRCKASGAHRLNVVS